MIFLFLLLTAWQGSAEPSPCQARLELKQHEGMLTVTGRCRNLLPTAARYRYELSLTRAGLGGRSQNTQRGEVEVAPQQEISLSQSQINASPQDTYRIHLRVLDLAGHVLAQDSATQASTR